MSGTLYTDTKARGLLPQAIIKHYNLDVKVVAPDATFAKTFPLKKQPAFVGPKGLKLTEVIAVVLYRMLQNFEFLHFPGTVTARLSAFS